MPKACKMAAEGLGSTVSPSGRGQEAKPPKSFDFFCLKHGKTATVTLKIQ